MIMLLLHFVGVWSFVFSGMYINGAIRNMRADDYPSAYVHTFMFLVWFVIGVVLEG